jgi:hypothetical protein
VIVDGAHMYMGSANWTGAGLGAKGDTRRNFELGFWSSDEELLDEAQAIFDHLWRGEECAGCGRRDVCDAPIAELPTRGSPRCKRAVRPLPTYEPRSRRSKDR